VSSTRLANPHRLQAAGDHNAVRGVGLPSNRYGTFSYSVGGLTASANYTVRLHFAEEYWTAAGSRVFNVVINGTERRC
jgi:hypothetical protein